MAFSVSQIAGICKGTVVTARPDDPLISDLLIDSRRLFKPGDCLFVALVSERNDGHRYIPELYENGVRSFLVARGDARSAMGDTRFAIRDLGYAMGDGRWAEVQEKFPGAAFIVVEDTLAALQQLAAFHRGRFGIPVIGITGSNGKTIVKEWLFQLLSRDLRIVRSPKSYNSQIGVPLSVWKMEPEHQLGIFEAGISMPGEMERIEPVIRPTIGVFTNIGSAHDEHFESHRQKTEEKLKLFSRAEILVYCSDYTLITECLQNPDYAALERFTWSRHGEADLRITGVTKEQGSTLITGVHQGESLTVTIPFTDDASIENAIHCWAVMLVCDMRYAICDLRFAICDPPVAHRPSPIADRSSLLADRLSHLAPIAMRLELKEAINHCSVINDYYNSDINSLGIAIDFLDQQNQHRKKTVILSDILQTGLGQDELYRGIGEMLALKKIGRVIGIGPGISKQADKFGMQKDFYPTTDEFLQQFPVSSFRDEVILLKGARPFEFEKISQALQQKSHETVLEINLDALVHNLNHYRSRLDPGVKTMAMVKAFSYGSGSFEIAGVLQFHRVDSLAVAYADEGVELRKAGIHLPVMVMSPEEQSLDTLLKFNLEPEIYSFRILDLLEAAMERNQTASQEVILIHLKLDTGMHRLGFESGDLEELLRRLAANPSLRVRSVFSHLAASEDPAEDEFSERQIAAFRAMSDKIAASLGYPVLRHILNSAGISRFPGAQFDMVRLGIGLYGVGSDETEQRKLRNVSTLRSVITQIKKIPAGDTIGYNRKGIATRDSVIAIIPIGYADGLNRRLGNGNGTVYINGHSAPVIGNICMDLTMIDITDLQSPIADPPSPIADRPSPIADRRSQIAPGDPVIIFGPDHPVTEMAKKIGTIPYEVLTTISRRVKRIYYHE